MKGNGFPLWRAQPDGSRALSTYTAIGYFANIAFSMSLSSSVDTEASSGRARIAHALDHLLHAKWHVDVGGYVLARLLHHRRRQREARLVVLALTNRRS